MAGNSKKKTGANAPKTADDFESVAKALGCDDDKARFEGKLAKAKPTPGK
jgi:hypothetical protein